MSVGLEGLGNLITSWTRRGLTLSPFPSIMYLRYSIVLVPKWLDVVSILPDSLEDSAQEDDVFFPCFRVDVDIVDVDCDSLS